MSSALMFNATSTLIEAFVGRLSAGYRHMYSTREPAFAGVLEWVGTMAMEVIANSDALYHDVEHSIMVTLVGQEILRGKHILDGGVEPHHWLHFIISLLCHDIGYVRGICPGDREGIYATDGHGGRVTMPPGATDAFLTPYHVERGKLFIRARFGGHPLIDAEVIARNIEHTRFPVPHADDTRESADYPGLVRAADLIGQMADPDYLRKLPALFHEFEETGANRTLGYQVPEDLRRGYPAFFWKMVSQPTQSALRYLRATREGREWVSNLYSHVFSEEHRQVL